MVEAEVGEDVNEHGSLGAAGVSQMMEAKPCFTLEQETFLKLCLRKCCCGFSLWCSCLSPDSWGVLVCLNMAVNSFSLSSVVWAW